jgi:hypothetical protein
MIVISFYGDLCHFIPPVETLAVIIRNKGKNKLFFMKINVKRGFALTGIVLISVLFINGISTSNLDMTVNSGSAAPDARFDFRYSGVVNTGNGVMPLVGQLSKDGLKLYFTSQNMRGNKQLYVMTRERAGDVFGTPKKLTGVGNDEGYDIVMPTLNGNETQMVFVSSSDGTQKGNDLYIASKVEGGFLNIKPLDEVNDPTMSDSYPWLSKDGLRLYFTKQKGSKITYFVAERTSEDSKFGAPVKLDVGFEVANNNMSCFLSNDEKEIFMLNGDKIYSATRKSLKDKFSAPVEIASSTDNNGFMNGITMTDNKAEMFVFNSVGFRNTQILKFDNAATVKPVIEKLVDNKTLEIRE